MRTIDADELKKMFPDKGEGAWTYNITAKAYIDAAPTVDQWRYPAKGELPNCTQRVLICYGREEHLKIVWWRQDFHRFGDALPTEIIAWQYIEPPKEEA